MWIIFVFRKVMTTVMKIAHKLCKWHFIRTIGLFSVGGETISESTNWITVTEQVTERLSRLWTSYFGWYLKWVFCTNTDNTDLDLQFVEPVGSMFSCAQLFLVSSADPWWRTKQASTSHGDQSGSVLTLTSCGCHKVRRRSAFPSAGPWGNNHSFSIVN